MTYFFDIVELVRVTCARLRRDFLWHSVAVHVAGEIVVGCWRARCPVRNVKFRGRIARAWSDHVEIISLRDGRVV